MPNDFLVFVVEDDKTMRVLLEAALGEDYKVELFESGEQCLERLAEGVVPGLCLVDVGLPGMNGYSLCRRFREMSGLAHLPVLFISNYDKLDDVLAGYDAGGDDYIVKPFDLAILQRKVESLLRIGVKHQNVIEKVRSSDELAALALANLDEYAVLIRFLRSLNDCDHPRSLTRLLFSLLGGYGLDAAIQIRLPGLEWTIGPEGENRPLEMAIMSHVRHMDRIFEFKMRAAYNYESITILVNNMPVENPELCGRIRDNVLIAAECANAKLLGIQASAENAHAKTTAAELLGALREEIGGFEAKYRAARDRGDLLTQEMLDQLAQACASLGLSDEQEYRIDSIIRQKTEVLIAAYDFSAETRAALEVLVIRLGNLQQPQDQGSLLDMTPTEEDSVDVAMSSVELF